MARCARWLAWILAGFCLAPSVLAQAGFGGSGLNMSGAPASKPPPYQPRTVRLPSQGPLVLEVRVQGNQAVQSAEILRHVETKAGRNLDMEVVQSDVRTLIRTGLFENVQPFTQEVQGGVVVTYQVDERTLIREIRFHGNARLSDKKLLKRTGLVPGSPLAAYRVEEARRQMEELYREQGFIHAKVTVEQQAKDGVVEFTIVEGPKQRILNTRFLGNTIASDARLKTVIQSKPGILWLINGTMDYDQLAADCEHLTAYYRRLGFFSARVSREVEATESGEWATVTFVIDEGPRYRIRDVVIVGNKVFTTEDLMSRLRLRSGDYFDMVKMTADAQALNDVYGSEGYITVQIEPEPRFSEKPGQLDLVYHITEGERYYVNRILVNIRGENPHTRESVVLNRFSISPGDIVDMREIRNTERRLKQSQLFQVNPAMGKVPTINVVPSPTDPSEEMAAMPALQGGY